MAEVLRRLGDLSATLDHVDRLTRLELTALGDRFGIAWMHGLLDAELREVLEKKAETQNNLANALAAQVEQRGGAAGARLGEAVAAYGAALRVWTEATDPVSCAMAQLNPGLACETLAGNTTCADPRAALRDAEERLAAALSGFDPVHMAYPHDQASTALARVRCKLGRG